MRSGHFQEIKCNFNHINDINNSLNNSQSLPIRIFITVTTIIIQCHSLIQIRKNQDKRYNNKFIQNKKSNKEVPKLAETLIGIDKVPRTVIVVIFDLQVGFDHFFWEFICH